MKWAPMNGWKRRQDGWFAHPDHAGWLRSSEGAWYEANDISEGIIEMTDSGPRVVPGWLLVGNHWVADEDPVVEELRQRLGKVVGGGR